MEGFMVSNVGGYILNGTIEGDKERECTYVGSRESSVIDYIIVNENCKNIINNFYVNEKTDSDHMPLILEIKKKKGNSRG